jgi:NADH:ubiquinone oxidoreductase subunit H
MGPYGLLQPVTNVIKLFIKESIYPLTSSSLQFTIAPLADST